LAIIALAKLREEGVDFRYNIVGDNQSEELLFLIDYYNLGDYVTLTGRVPQQEVFDLMNSSSAFLLPSREEGLANVAVEAMALGLPVISSDCNGMPELIEDKQNGLLFNNHDPESLAAAISYFASCSYDEINAMRTAARKKVEEQHNFDQMAEGMLALYQEVVASGKHK
jgi:colanic acid/amylovoran biosynthesis glycosyltransferase